MPQVSVLIPNYNHARFLDKRLQSVLNQTFRDLEVIYLDDASTDNSNEVAHTYAFDARLRFINNVVNSGSPFKQWNKGVREAKGKYVWIAESDDYADERLLERLVGVLELNPNVGVAYCQSRCVNEENEELGTMEWWTRDLNPTRWKDDFRNDGRDECARFLARKNTLPNASAVVFRREVFLEAGGADETMRVCGDWMCWAKCLLRSDVAFVAEPLNFFRTHSASVRNQTEDNGLLTLEGYRVASFITRECEVSQANRRQVCGTLVDSWMKAVLRESSLVPRGRNLRIYRLARRVDARLHLALARRIAGFIWRRFKSWARRPAGL